MEERKDICEGYERDSVQQLDKLAKDKNERFPIYPLTYIQAVYDARTKERLDSILWKCNNVYLPWMGSAGDTRIQLPFWMRRKGIIITYKNLDDETITEKLTYDLCIADDFFRLDSSWTRITDALPVGGNITIGSNGNWFQDGVDTGFKAQGPKGDNGLTPMLRTVNNKLRYSYDGEVWYEISEYIAAWFRYQDNKIQISRDQKTWSDLSKPFTQDLYIKGYVATSSALPSTGVKQGDIYMVGPTYAAEDTEHKNPIYRMYVYNDSGWVDNGVFQSIAAGVVQTIGNSETEVMSQKAVSSIVGLDTYPVFSDTKPYVKGEIVNYGGLLYEFTADHEAGAWIGTDARETSLRGEVTKIENNKLNSFKDIEITSIEDLDDGRRPYGVYGVTLLNDDDNFGKRFTFYHLPNGGVDSEYVYQRIQAHNPVYREDPYYPSRSFHRVGWTASSDAPYSWTNWVCEDDYYCRKAESSYKGILSYSGKEEYIVKCIKYIKVWVDEKYIDHDIALSVIGVATTGEIMFQVYNKTLDYVLGSIIKQIDGEPEGIIRYKKDALGDKGHYAIDIVFDWSLYTDMLQTASSTVKVEPLLYGNDSYYSEFRLTESLESIDSKIDYFKDISIDPYCTVVNGAIEDSNTSYHIPVGYTGKSSIIYLDDTINKFLYPEGTKIVVDVDITYTNKTVEELQREKIRIQKVSGAEYTNITLENNMTFTETDGKVILSINFEYVITYEDIASYDRMRFYYQNGFPEDSTVTKEVVVKVSNINIRREEKLNDKVRELDKNIGQILRPTTKIIRVDRWDTTADFYGNDAIQRAIDSITDASPSNVYDLVVNGIFEAKQASDYHLSVNRNAFIKTKNYVNIKGSGRNTCIIQASLPDNLGSSFAYSSYEGITFQSISELSGMTVIGRNIRYPIHIDGGATGCKDYLLKCTDSKVWHQGNTGDAINWLSWHPLGIGMSDGQTIICENCEIEGKAHAFYSHTNADYKNASSLTFKNCTFIANGEGGYSGGINVLGSIQPMGTGKSDKMIFINCKWENQGIIRYNDSPFISKNAANQKADHAEYELFIDVNPQPFDNSSLRGFGLKIKSKSTGSSSSVRFDESSSAFPLIIGKSNESNEFINRYGFNQKYGYQYRDGGNGLSGWACGLWDIGENAVGNPENTYMNSLGKRLGDCSSVNKTLTVIIDGTSYNIVFNKNYNGTDDSEPSTYTNDQIIDEILYAIGNVATIEQYPVGRDYYPSFDNVVRLKNTDTIEVMRGMGIIFNGNNSFRLAENSDGKIDGITIDDGRVGDFCRIITAGSLYAMNTNQRFSVKEVSLGTRDIGVKAGISLANKGVFDVNAEPKLIQVGRIKDVYDIIKP